MNKNNKILAGAGFATLAILTISANPAFAKCVKFDPIFGMKTYVDDKYCAKKTIKRKIRKSTRHGVRPRVMGSNSQVRELQSLLTAMGYNPGPIDGVSGPATRKAASEYNGAVGLQANADISQTLKSIQRVSGK